MVTAVATSGGDDPYWTPTAWEGVRDMVNAYSSPTPRGHMAPPLGWILLGVSPFVVAKIVLAASSSSSISWPLLAFGCAVGVVIVATGIALIRRHTWALVAAAMESFAASVAAFAYVVSVHRHPPGPPGTDGAAYTMMGGLMFSVGLAVLGGVLLRPSIRRTLRTPDAGWYPDPWKVGRVRWWDGVGWCAPVLR